VKRVVGATLGLLGALVVAWCSRASWAPADREGALIRLAIRARPERLEHCRRLSDEELAGVPAHMRERVQCEGRTARYRFSVGANDRALWSREVAGGGALGDRPISFVEDLEIAPGATALRLEIVRLDSALAAPEMTDSAGSDRERRMAATRARARQEALPPVVALDTTLMIRAGEVVLVTYDPDQRRLVLPLGAR
jgi:hypothetical protein